MKSVINHCKKLLARQTGVALLPVIFGIMIMGLFMTAGLSLIDASARKNKVEATRKKMNHAAEAVLNWSAQNGRLPDNTEFTALTGLLEDEWHQNIIYAYDSNLTRTASGGICGRPVTAISSSSVSDIAFLIISGGEDFTLDSAPNTDGPYSGTASLAIDDIVKSIDLNQVKAESCFSETTTTRLQILNNDLPNACTGVNYSATLYVQGGVLPYTWSYTAKPAWLTLSASGTGYTCQGMPTSAGTDTAIVKVTDTLGNTVQKRFDIAVSSCAGP